jgi:hypothetical protein
MRDQPPRIKEIARAINDTSDGGVSGRIGPLPGRGQSYRPCPTGDSGWKAIVGAGPTVPATREDVAAYVQAFDELLGELVS